MTIAAEADLHVGDIAREADVNIQTVRYYERRGLVLPRGRSSAGYRLYTTDAIRVVRFIKRAHALGFSLDEVAELLELRRHARGSVRNVRALASAKVVDINARLHGLLSMRDTLSRLVADCQCDAHASPEDCVILNALDDAPPLPTAVERPVSQFPDSDTTLAATCGAHTRATARRPSTAAHAASDTELKLTRCASGSARHGADAAVCVVAQ